MIAPLTAFLYPRTRGPVDQGLGQPIEREEREGAKTAKRRSSFAALRIFAAFAFSG